MTDPDLVRINETSAVPLSHICRLRIGEGGHLVQVGSGPGSVELPVDPARLAELKDRLAWATKREWSA